jgi:hypothetical protein
MMGHPGGVVLCVATRCRNAPSGHYALMSDADRVRVFEDATTLTRPVKDLFGCSYSLDRDERRHSEADTRRTWTSGNC